MTKPDLTPEQIEIAAKKLCQMAGDDPNELITTFHTGKAQRMKKYQATCPLIFQGNFDKRVQKAIAYALEVDSD